MSPQQKAQIQARLAKLEAERNTGISITAQSNTMVSSPGLRKPARPVHELVEGVLCDPEPRPDGDTLGKNSRDRYKLGQAAYMREYRARKKAV